MCTTTQFEKKPSPLYTFCTLLANPPPPWRVYVFYGCPLNNTVFNLFHKILNLHMYWAKKWKDNRLSWNPEKNDNITELKFTEDQVSY